MPRSVNHVASRARRKKVLNMAKGYFGARKNVWTVAKNAVEKALKYAYRDRKAKKRHFRTLWIARINAAVRLEGLSYSVFMGMYAKAGLGLNRKALADLAMNHPEVFSAVLNTVKTAKPEAEAKTVFTPAYRLRITDAPAAPVAKVAPVKKEAKPTITDAPVAKAASTGSKADDLKIVEGIGPAIEKLFHAANIHTFAELASTSVEAMQAILDEAGARYRVHNPATWGEQAGLARDGKFDELKVLQDRLNAGRE